MNTDKIYVERMSDPTSRFASVDRVKSGMKQRIGWNVIEQLLRDSSYIKSEEYLGACEVDESGIIINIENKDGN